MQRPVRLISAQELVHRGFRRHTAPCTAHCYAVTVRDDVLLHFLVALEQYLANLLGTVIYCLGEELADEGERVVGLVVEKARFHLEVRAAFVGTALFCEYGYADIELAERARDTLLELLARAFLGGEL